ncbi:centromere-associated protein E [Caerostris extrusa]|uniref:Centromere-associated protein E n=1 Tax=Caerostris extrusa TaxID=172846 RepID=A0AAV4SAU2_CAEEX|nr:centromere-associated protein E [Caerostris extrusa]
METYLKTISDYKYDLDLKEKQITILNDKAMIQKQMIDTFQCELALKANKSDTNEKEIQTNISNHNIPTFMDQSCQVTYIEDISLISINSRNTSQLQLGEEDTSNLERNLSFNCDKSINENEIFVNQCPEKLLQQNLQSVMVEEYRKENPVELLNHFEATLKDLTELKLFTLEFMKRDMKKEYLGDIESLDQNVNAVLTDQIKIEITTLKEMLMKIDFYLEDRADSAEYFNNFLEDKLIEMSSLEDKLKEKESEFRILGVKLINMENDLKELIQKVKSLGSTEENSELEDNLIIHSDDKPVECINNMQKIIFVINNHINKKTSSINELSLKLNEAQNKLKILQEDQNIFKLTKSIQTVEDQEYLELSQKLKEVEASKKETDDEINNFKLKLDLMTKEKESFKQELEDKIAFYNNKLEVMKKNFDSEKEEWAAKTTECVQIVEEKCDQMLMDQENKYFDEIDQIKQEHKLELIQKKNEHWEQCQIKRDELEEEHQKRIQEIKNKLITEIEERYKEKEELENEIRILKKEINHFREYTNHIKDKYKQLATEFCRQKEELKTLEKRQDVQEKVTEKSIKTKNTQTDPLQHSDIEAIREKACADNVKEAEILCRRLENELEAKKAKIMSLNTNNACMVREIMALKKELNQKGFLLLNCKCRIFSKMTESQNYKKKENIEKIESTNYKPEKETESTDLKTATLKHCLIIERGLNSEAILQLDIVKDAIKEAKEEERAVLNSGSGPATEMKCHYLQAKLNKTNKELAMLKKEMDKFKAHPLKKKILKNDLPDRDLTAYITNPVLPICNELAPKLKPKKILKERNKKSEGPVTALQEGIKNQNLNYENIEHAAIRNPNIEETKINQHAERKDKIKKTWQEIEKFAGEPECKQQ